MAILGLAKVAQMNKWRFFFSYKPLLEHTLCRDQNVTQEFFAREKDQNLVKLAADRCLLLGAETGNQKLVKQALANGADINTYARKSTKILDGITGVEADLNLSTNNHRWHHSFRGEECQWEYTTPLQRAK